MGTTYAPHATIDLLNELLAYCHDGKRGYEQVMDDVDDQNLQKLFAELAGQRSEFIRELSERILRFGGEPDNVGTITGTAHRGWTELRVALADLTGSPVHAVLAECERGEDRIKDAYRESLTKPTDSETKQMLARHYQQIARSHDKVRALRDASA
jgi:uncharacterized protein (TIGR02284 family)